MAKKESTGRRLKRELHRLLLSENINYEEIIANFSSLSSKKVINALFPFIYHTKNLTVRWHAIIIMGAIVARLAESDMEYARIIMRRLMWNLNDESGGIGWGSPEVMGEIVSQHPGLAKEYTSILISYIREDGNFLEYPPMQIGALWGIGRLAERKPEMAKKAIPYVISFLDSSDPGVRGHAIWVLGILRATEACNKVKALKDDEALFKIFLNRRLQTLTVKEMVKKVLKECLKSPHEKS